MGVENPESDVAAFRRQNVIWSTEPIYLGGPVGIAGPIAP